MQAYALLSSINCQPQGGPSWVTVLSALLTPTVAVVAAIIGFLQWKTAEKKRQADMFNIKYNLYKRVEHQLFIASTNREPVDRLEFIRTMDELPFVFKPWVKEFRETCLKSFYASQAMGIGKGTPQEGLRGLGKAYVDLLQTFYEDMHIG